jgi:hypothetical protein
MRLGAVMLSSRISEPAIVLQNLAVEHPLPNAIFVPMEARELLPGAEHFFTV